MSNIVGHQYPCLSTLFPSANFSGRRAPWAVLESDIDRLFEAAFSNCRAPAFQRQAPVDLYEEENNIFVRVELSGFNREAIAIEIIEGYLNLSATRKGEGAASEQIQIQRSVALPEAVQNDKVIASYENGILLVTLPKCEESKPKKVTIAIS